MIAPGQLVRWLLRQPDRPQRGHYAIVEAATGDTATIRLDNGDRHTVNTKTIFVLPEEYAVKISKLFPSKYVKAADLGNKPVTLTIKTLKVETLGHGAEQEQKPVLYFEKATKGLVLNRTNAMTIASLYGDESEEWVGKRVTLFATTVRAFGKTQDTIRVKEEVPAQPRPQAQAAPHVEEAEIDDAEDVLDSADEAQA